MGAFMNDPLPACKKKGKVLQLLWIRTVQRIRPKWQSRATEKNWPKGGPTWDDREMWVTMEAGLTSDGMMMKKAPVG